MPTIAIDILEGAGLERKDDPNAGTTLYTGSRIAAVSGLTDGSDDQTRTALLRAMSIVAAAHPPGEAYDDTIPYCKIVGYAADGMTDDVARVRLIYDTPVGQTGSGSGVAWTIESDGDVVESTTQINHASGGVLQVSWQDPDDADNRMQDVCNVRYGELLRRVRLSAIMPVANVPTYEAAQKSVNNATFRGLAKGYWRFKRFATVAYFGAAYVSCVVELDSRVNRDWSEVHILRDTHTNKLVRVADADATALRNADYVYGTETRNGILKAGLLPTTDFSTLFAVIGP